MIAWLLHRISGIGIVIFVSMHVFAAFFLNAVHGGTTNAMLPALTDFYESLPMQIFVLFCSALPRHQRPAHRRAGHVSRDVEVQP